MQRLTSHEEGVQQPAMYVVREPQAEEDPVKRARLTELRTEGPAEEGSDKSQTAGREVRQDVSETLVDGRSPLGGCKRTEAARNGAPRK